MILIVCRRGGCNRVGEYAASLLRGRLGVNITLVHSGAKEVEWHAEWYAVLPAECREEVEETDAYDTECVSRILEEKLNEVVDTAIRIAEAYDEYVGAIVVAQAPTLPPWGPMNVFKGSVYAIWLRTDVPANPAELELYRLALALAHKCSPLEATELLHIPFVNIQALAKLSGASRVGKGILVRHCRST